MSNTTKIQICVCSSLPGIHKRRDEDGCEFEEFIPTEAELKYQEECIHDEQVFEGVCNACGKVIE